MQAAGESGTPSSAPLDSSSTAADVAGGGGGVAASGTSGRHRIIAELNRLEQENRFLLEELEELEKMDTVSAACEELLHTVGNRQDPLLPVIHGSICPSWDRWFEGPKDKQRCTCWMLRPSLP